ncbi:lysoplasmalogenase [Dyella lipolytica]|uniref:Lysoplasmalogenase n=1 Tax=Dyella lipolytica TaxID=1867835 RepID=A0ABW8ISY6_9GAMM|nr:lysoplasmalogenase [Dyella lipolytica]GLQ47340.1 lysoplasmalogenase [Dyella lipolytica]
MSAVTSTQTSSSFGRGFTFIALAVGGAILGAVSTNGGADAWHWLHWLCKPLATLLIFTMVWRTTRPVSATYRRYVLIGIAFCLLGDILLMLPQNLFVPGLLSFLLAHGMFIAAFSSDVRFAARWWPWLVCLVFGAGMGALLWPGIAAMLRVPVLVYVAVLATMAGQALGRASWLRARSDARAASARFAGLGAVLFMASDSLLAWDRFRAALPWAALYILVTYYMALWLIARSVERGPTAITGEQG